MRKKMYKSQNGSISMFVMVAMAFFLTTIIGVFVVSGKRAQTQTESLNILQGKYYTEGEEQTKYYSKISDSGKIPIYTKEQLWSIGENKLVEIDGKIYDFSQNNVNNYELKNDIIINIKTDLANSKFKDNYIYGNNTINKNNFGVYYYYEGNYYVPVQYSDGTTTNNLCSGIPVLSASGTEFKNINTNTNTSELSGKYYLFDYKNYYLTNNDLEENWKFSALNNYVTNFEKNNFGNMIRVSCTANNTDHSLGGNVGMIIYNEAIDVTNIDSIIMECSAWTNYSNATNYTTIGISNTNSTTEYQDYYSFEKSQGIEHYGTNETKYTIKLDLREYTGKYYLKVTTRHELPDNIYYTSTTQINKIYPIFK